MKRSLSHLFSLAVLISLGTISTQASAQLYVDETTSLVTELNLALPVNPSSAGNYWSGLLNITPSQTQGGPGTSFAAFCFDPFQYANGGVSNYLVSSGLGSLDQTKATWVNNLYSQNYAGAIGNATNAAAFQLALWDLAKDDGNLTSGSVRITDLTNLNNHTVVDRANSMITGAKSGAGAAQYSFSLYTSTTAQDYVVASSVTAVPEPQTYVMLLSGICLLSFTARRRLHKTNGI